VRRRKIEIGLADDFVKLFVMAPQPSVVGEREAALQVFAPGSKRQAFNK